MDFSNPRELERRRPVWNAIADLCLDTEITDESIDYIARTIREQGFSAEEAQIIAYKEVFPAVYSNLQSIAGEWAGFNADWLEKEILHASRKTDLLGWWSRLLGYPMVANDWRRVLGRL